MSSGRLSLRAARLFGCLLLRRADEPMSPARFRALADPLLANSLATIRDYIAIWIEDESGQVIASSGPANLIAAFSGAKAIAGESRMGALRFLLAE